MACLEGALGGGQEDCLFLPVLGEALSSCKGGIGSLKTTLVGKLIPVLSVEEVDCGSLEAKLVEF